MISPHLLKVVVSYSTSLIRNEGYSMTVAKATAQGMWGERPILVIEPKTKKPGWCHMILATGPGLTEGAKSSELIIIWWSEMGPDTDRVLSTIDWEKYAKDVKET